MTSDSSLKAFLLTFLSPEDADLLERGDLSAHPFQSADFKRMAESPVPQGLDDAQRIEWARLQATARTFLVFAKSVGRYAMTPRALLPAPPTMAVWKGTFTGFQEKIFFYTAIKPEKSNGVVVVYVRGLMHPVPMEEHPLTRELTGRGYTVYSYDPRISQQGVKHLADMESFVSLIRGQNPGSKIYLVGNSLGARPVRYYLEAHGNEINGAVFEVPAFTATDQVAATFAKPGQKPEPVVFPLDGKQISTPSLFILGETDKVVVNERTQADRAKFFTGTTEEVTIPGMSHHAYKQPDHKVASKMADWLDSQMVVAEWDGGFWSAEVILGAASLAGFAGHSLAGLMAGAGFLLFGMAFSQPFVSFRKREKDANGQEVQPAWGIAGASVPQMQALDSGIGGVAPVIVEEDRQMRPVTITLERSDEKERMRFEEEVASLGYHAWSTLNSIVDLKLLRCFLDRMVLIIIDGPPDNPQYLDVFRSEVLEVLAHVTVKPELAGLLKEEISLINALFDDNSDLSLFLQNRDRDFAQIVREWEEGCLATLYSQEDGEGALDKILRLQKAPRVLKWFPSWPQFEQEYLGTTNPHVVNELKRLAARGPGHRLDDDQKKRMALYLKITAARRKIMVDIIDGKLRREQRLPLSILEFDSRRYLKLTLNVPPVELDPQPIYPSRIEGWWDVETSHRLHLRPDFVRSKTVSPQVAHLVKSVGIESVQGVIEIPYYVHFLRQVHEYGGVPPETYLGEYARDPKFMANLTASLRIIFRFDLNGFKTAFALLTALTHDYEKVLTFITDPVLERTAKELRKMRDDLAWAYHRMFVPLEAHTAPVIVATSKPKPRAPHHKPEDVAQLAGMPPMMRRWDMVSSVADPIAHSVAKKAEAHPELVEGTRCHYSIYTFLRYLSPREISDAFVLFIKPQKGQTFSPGAAILHSEEEDWEFHTVLYLQGRIYDFNYQGKPGTPIDLYSKEMFQDTPMQLMPVPAGEYAALPSWLIPEWEHSFGEKYRFEPLDLFVASTLKKQGAGFPMDDVKRMERVYATWAAREGIAPAATSALQNLDADLTQEMARILAITREDAILIQSVIKTEIRWMTLLGIDHGNIVVEDERRNKGMLVREGRAVSARFAGDHTAEVAVLATPYPSGEYAPAPNPRKGPARLRPGGAPMIGEPMIGAPRLALGSALFAADFLLEMDEPHSHDEAGLRRKGVVSPRHVQALWGERPQSFSNGGVGVLRMRIFGG